MSKFNELISVQAQSDSRLAKIKEFQDKWAKSGLLEGLQEKDKGVVATLLENQGKQLFLEAASNTTNMGSPQSYYTAGYGDQWSGIALPLVRRIFGNIIGKEFVSVQPMSMPVGLVFWLDFKYATEKFSHHVDESIYSASTDMKSTDTNTGIYGAGRWGYTLNHHSGSVTATASAVTFADVNYDSAYKATGSYVKLSVPTAGLTDYNPDTVRAIVLKSGSVDEADVQQQFTQLINSGANLTFIVNAPAATGTYTVYYTKETKDSKRGDFEDRADFSVPNANDAESIVIPKVKLAMKSESITARTRKLGAQWTQEMQQDMEAFQGIDAEQEMTAIMSDYIAVEIDQEILDLVMQSVPTKHIEYWSARNNEQWNGTGFDAPTSVGAGGFYNTQGEWFQTLGTKLQKVSNNIGSVTHKGGANFLVMGPKISTIIESIPGFAGDSAGDDNIYNFGSQKIGALNSRYKVYKSNYIKENVILLGFKGQGFTESGAVYAPYIPLISTPTVYDPETFTPGKAVFTRYATKVMRGEFYGKVYVSGLDTI